MTRPRLWWFVTDGEPSPQIFLQNQEGRMLTIGSHNKQHAFPALVSIRVLHADLEKSQILKLTCGRGCMLTLDKTYFAHTKSEFSKGLANLGKEGFVKKITEEIGKCNPRAMSQLWKSINETFNGFSNGDIFNGSLWKIQPKSRSTTIAVNPDIYMYDQLNQELCGMYGVPERKGKNGMIYRCMMSNGHDDDLLQQVAITCYQSTSTLSIQGGAHQKWVEDILPEIETGLSKQTCVHSRPGRLLPLHIHS